MTTNAMNAAATYVAGGFVFGMLAAIIGRVLSRWLPKQ